MKTKIFILIFLANWSFSCFSKPAVWLESRPNDPKYWHGIGFSSHIESSNPKVLAKEHAIHEISSQIKINISSELDIITSDIDGTIDNVITSVMNSRVNLLLPELELVDNYSTDKGVYFYVRLNKNNYYKTIENLRANAKEISLNYIIQSDKEFGKRSLMLIQDAWKEIYPFNDEPLKVQYRNQNYNLFSLIRQKYDDYINRISVKAFLENDNIRTIIDRDNILTIKVFDKESGKALKDIPIKVKQSNESFTFISDEKGYIKVDIGNKIRNSRFEILFFLDHTMLFEEEDRENIILSSKILGSKNINVVPSKVQIISLEKNLNDPLKSPILEPEVKELFSRYVEFVKSNPDFYLHIDVNTIVKAENVEPGFPFFSYCNASVSLVDAENNQEFFVVNLADIKGGDFGSFKTAGIRAYDQMKGKIVQELKTKLLNL